MSFKFLDYSFNQDKHEATFRYQGEDEIIFTEKVAFDASKYTECNHSVLDRALFLAFIVLGTSYYKTHPTRNVVLDNSIDKYQADFFNNIYQEGLSQFAFENKLTRSDLAIFEPSTASNAYDSALEKTENPSRLVLLSGGKDSLLTAEKLQRENLPFRSVYISNSNTDLPEIVSSYGKPVVIRRQIDRENLKQSAGLNGHVPVTMINESLALIQAILLGASEIYIGLGREGEEPHAFIDDLPVNHQWSKMPATQKHLKSYINTYISPNLQIKSLLEDKSELEVAGEFVELCWDKFGDRFSSCNVANYKQNANNDSLKWCGKCPKCANTFLLFTPYLPLEKQPFGRDLFLDPDLVDTFKGLLGVDGIIKPFECVGEIEELRQAYASRHHSYGNLPFEVPKP